MAPDDDGPDDDGPDDDGADHDGADQARQRLAAAQAELARALLAGAPPPPGFDPRRVRVEAEALLAKRRRVTELLRPDLADALGERCPALFAEWAPKHPRTDGVTARADADAFAGWLRANGHLPGPVTAGWRRALRRGRAAR
jgi:hypothetical protein